MIEWKDTTSYSQSDRERIPRVLTCKIGKYDIILHRIHGIPGTWYLSSRYLHIKEIDLSDDDINSCKIKAIEFIKYHIKDSIESMQHVLNQLA
jgi:hypothetical protein